MTDRAEHEAALRRVRELEQEAAELRGRDYTHELERALSGVQAIDAENQALALREYERGFAAARSPQDAVLETKARRFARVSLIALASILFIVPLVPRIRSWLTTSPYYLYAHEGVPPLMVSDALAHGTAATIRAVEIAIEGSRPRFQACGVHGNAIVAVILSLSRRGCPAIFVEAPRAHTAMGNCVAAVLAGLDLPKAEAVVRYSITIP